jgi:TRAP-type C4-dicarboxylate transport system permease large subunit
VVDLRFRDHQGRQPAPVDSLHRYASLANVSLGRLLLAGFLLTPMLAPIVAQAGIDPIHFGLVFVLSTMIGLITPPVGITMFITCQPAGSASTSSPERYGGRSSPWCWP